ncbi:D-alanyl-D-alanine carboxypeptidase [Adhaeribacter arboris]|uniref:D-alanyl-D-alanine carboxypeptidase n=1 Tax=Adhaeribacter arboris TaxID=2072846 RepID=A0A2T2YGX3_9BACT|nr:serine hydrolase domain-containing protein [Adhaeribacter arboris]PSR54753.1 D-alanyl-D-alanine carboxypeptidase [Adhaeribacter arboris]
MKSVYFLLGLTLLNLAVYAQNGNSQRGLNSGVKINFNYVGATELQTIMNRYTAKDLPGIALAVYKEGQEWWSGASGFARVESKTPMTIQNLQYLQSVTKTYMAVAALKLSEEGKLNLDAVISKYLPQEYNHLIKNIDQITVRMLLNHTSGIAEYNSDPEYTAAVILHPTEILPMEEVIRCLANEEPQFAPGTHYRYTNTNYFLLTVIADVITGNHAQYLEEKIFKPLQLHNTFYRSSPGYLKYPLLPDCYWDILNSGRPANITPMQVANVAALRGDDGIVATPIDAIKFLKGLVEGKLIKAASLAQMQQWVKNDAGKPAYGMGLHYIEEGGIIGFGHGGGGLGAGCLLLYVPAKKTYVFLATNIGLVIDGPVGLKVNDMKNEVLAVVLR